MSRRYFSLILGLAALCAFSLSWVSAEQAKPANKPADKPPEKKLDGPDLSEYRTLDKAITTRISKAPPTTAGRGGYLGVHIAPDAKGKLTVEDVAVDSPAAKAGLLRGDVLVAVAGEKIASADQLRDLLLSQSPTAKIKIGVLRKDKPVELEATLTALSRPMQLPSERASLGITIGEVKEGEGAPITRVTTGSAAGRAGVKTGEILVKVDGERLNDSAQLRDLIATKRPGDIVVLTFLRNNKEVDVKVELASEGGADPRLGWDTRRVMWRKDVYRLAVVPIEYPDVKHNPKITKKDWEESLFSKGTYVNKNAVTGGPVYGSLNDYYLEQSYGKLRVEGKFFDWVEVSKKRGDYSQGTGTGGPNRTALLSEALDLLYKRDGKDCLRNFDGIFFLYAGERVQTSRGGLYWPHRSTFTHGGTRWSYFIMQEGGARMSNISVICHEFGHMLGLPDLYARPENPGSEGVGVWCAMSNQAGAGRPQHFSAWCKEQLGWINPVVIDPTVKQKLILSPINDSNTECIKVLVRPDGSEYLLLENRRRKGFDASLPAEGLLIWRIVANRPILEESHGVEGPQGPRVFTTSVPYPSPANDAFTPFTTPSSRSQLGGGLPVYITNIRKLPDGRITLHVGYDYQ